MELSKEEKALGRGGKSPSGPGPLSNLLQVVFARKKGKGIRRQGSSHSREYLVVAGDIGGSNLLYFGTSFCGVGVSWVNRMSVEFPRQWKASFGVFRGDPPTQPSKCCTKCFFFEIFM